MFFKGSRYESVPDAIYVSEDGREIPYKRLRVLPYSPAQRIHIVQHGDRLDRVAYQYYGDPEQFYRIADANRALIPAQLTRVVGRRLRISVL